MGDLGHRRRLRGRRPLISFEQAGGRAFSLDGFTFSLQPRAGGRPDREPPQSSKPFAHDADSRRKNMYGAVPGYSKTTLHRLYPKPDIFGRLLNNDLAGAPGPGPSRTASSAWRGPATGPSTVLSPRPKTFTLDRALYRSCTSTPGGSPTSRAQPSAPLPVLCGDTVADDAFEVPSGAHLLLKLPTGW